MTVEAEDDRGREEVVLDTNECSGCSDSPSTRKSRRVRASVHRGDGTGDSAMQRRRVYVVFAVGEAIAHK